MTEILNQIAATRTRVFIHGLETDTRFMVLDASLRSGKAVSTRELFPEQLSGGKTFLVHRHLILGPEPNDADIALINTRGFTRINVTAEINRSPAGLTNWIMAELKGKKGAFYVSGFKTEQEMEAVYKVISGRFYGPQNIDIKISGQDVTRMGRSLFVGLLPASEEFKMLADMGISTIIYIQKAEDQADQLSTKSSQIAKDQGLKFVILRYKPGNVDNIIATASADNNPCYVAIDSRQRSELAQDIDAAKLFYAPNQI